MSKLMRTLAALVALVVAISIAACGGGDDSQSGDTSASGDSGGQPVEIEFWHGQTQKPAELLQSMIDEFNRTHSDVVVSKDSGGVNSDRPVTSIIAGTSSILRANRSMNPSVVGSTQCRSSKIIRTGCSRR